MHKLIILSAALAVLAAPQSSAQTQQKLTINHATVFLQGAQLSSTAKLKLPKGESEVLFTNVAGDINTASLSVNGGNNVLVESAVFQNNYMVSEVLSPRGKELKDSIEIVGEQRSSIADKLTTISEQITILQTNRKAAGEHTGLSVAELTKLLDLVSTKMEGLLNQKHKQEVAIKKTDDYLNKLKKQLDEETKKGYQPGGQLLVKFYAKEPVTNEVSVTYTVPNAGWSPTYDVRVDDIAKPASFYYKANLHQNCGVKWENVRLTLSTGNPNEGANAPVISPWYLSFYEPVAYYNRSNSYAKRSLARGEEAAGDMVAAAAPTTLNEVVVVDNSGINTTFDIELPYTIVNDGKENLVAIKKYDLNASYRYYAVPRMDKDAFLQAQITNWEDMNLIPGPTNIYYEGTFVGQGYVDVRNTSDTLTFSLGRDKKIVVRREQDKKLRSVRTVGSNVREAFAYTISVRNTRKDAINIVIQDQLPVSNDKDIVVEDKETGNSEYEETTGLMKWTLSMKPNENTNLKYGYTVKYPKGKKVAGL
jgi:uncharacterized protein (TIGR02231 family)